MKPYSVSLCEDGQKLSGHIRVARADDMLAALFRCHIERTWRGKSHERGVKWRERLTGQLEWKVSDCDSNMLAMILILRLNRIEMA